MCEAKPHHNKINMCRFFAYWDDNLTISLVTERFYVLELENSMKGRQNLSTLPEKLL